MRFLNRQLLRGIIAAGLAVAGASSGVASPGKLAPQWKDICFISEIDKPLQESWNQEASPTPCLLGISSVSVDELCEAATQQVFTVEKEEEQQTVFFDAKPILKFVSSTADQSKLCSYWVHGIQTSSNWLSHWMVQRDTIARQFQSQTAKLISSLNFVNSSDNSSNPVETVPSTSNSHPVGGHQDSTQFSGNIFVFLLESTNDQSINEQSTIEPESSLSQEAENAIAKSVDEIAEPNLNSAAELAVESIAEQTASLPGNELEGETTYESSLPRPPKLEGDLQWNMDQLLAMSELDPHGMGHCKIPVSTNELGHNESNLAVQDNEIPSDDSDLFESAIATIDVAEQEISSPVFTNPSESISETESRTTQSVGLQGRSILESWVEPNWDLHSWAFSTVVIPDNEFRYEPGSWFPTSLIKSPSDLKPVENGSAVNDETTDSFDVSLNSEDTEANVISQSAPAVESVTPELATEIIYKDLLAELEAASQSQDGPQPQEASLSSEDTVANDPAISKSTTLATGNENESSVDNLDQNLAIESLAHGPSYSLADMPDEYTAPPEELAASALASVTSGPTEIHADMDQPLDEASRLAAKAIAARLKQLGELLIQSADRLNQVSNAVDVASRPSNQR